MNRRSILAAAAAAVATPTAMATATWPTTDGHAVASEPAIGAATEPWWPASLMDTGGRSWPATGPAMSAWSALPTPCVVCGQTIEYMSVVVGGYACDRGRGRPCADQVAKPPQVAGWPCNIPPDWPVWRMPDGHRCQHCGRAGVAALEWPQAGWWMCAPGRPAGRECVCTVAACCGEPDRVGDELQAVRGYLVFPLGRIERVEGPLGRRMFLVGRPGEVSRWYAEHDLVV